MRYLGIASMGHDASVTVVHGNEIVFAAHQERYSGKKNDGMLSKELVDICRGYGFDEVIWYENPYNKAVRQLLNGQIVKGFKTLFVKSHLKKLGIVEPLSFVDHHESHACGGYFTSGFTNAVILVCDAIGEWDTISVWKADGDAISKIHSQEYPNSLGLFYSAFTQRVGKKPNEEEYIMMGMAALGKPIHKQRILDDFVTIIDDGFPVFSTNINMHKGIMDWAPDLSSDQDLYDIAASVQEITEDFLVRITSAMRCISSNLVLCGGVALNCKANTKIAQMTKFDNIWLMPNPGDAGSSLGAIASKIKKQLNWESPYLGCDIGHDTDFYGALSALLNGDVIGLATGRAEFGPRALGHRSILVDPRGAETKDKVNQFKRREEFRPFAPMIMAEYAHDYFDMPVNTSPYMQFTAKCKFPDKFPAITHVDGTSRVQTISKYQEPQVYELLRRFHEKTGCPMLLNTSMNIKGKPLVNTWDQAIDFQNETGISVY